MANYVDKKELDRELLISLEQNSWTKPLLDMFMLMVNEINKPLQYKNEDDRDDCKSGALMDLILYWDRFDPTNPNANSFSFFTQMIKNGMGKAFKKLRCQKITENSISMENLFLNV